MTGIQVRTLKAADARHGTLRSRTHPGAWLLVMLGVDVPFQRLMLFNANEPMSDNCVDECRCTMRPVHEHVLHGACSITRPRKHAR